jgi:polysaccharide biosynthesis/export protein
MTKLKTIATCLLCWTAAAYAVTPAAPQREGANRAENAPEKNSEAAKRTGPPPFTQSGEYVVEPPDLLYLRLEEGLPGRPIEGERLVRPDGTISIGWYGDLDVAGLTVDEIKTRVIGLLRKFIRDEYLGLVDVDASGELVIDPATGKPKQIDPKDSKKLRVEVTQCNSKCFYVLGETRSPGRFPFTGTERIVDAINAAGGLSAVADSENVILFRADSRGEPAYFTVDLNQIIRGKPVSVNHSLEPGDRVVVHRRARAAPPVHGASDRPVSVSSKDASLLPLEKRITTLEHELDLILEAIKRPRS